MGSFRLRLPSCSSLLNFCFPSCCLRQSSLFYSDVAFKFSFNVSSFSCSNSSNVLFNFSSFSLPTSLSTSLPSLLPTSLASFFQFHFLFQDFPLVSSLSFPFSFSFSPSFLFQFQRTLPSKSLPVFSQLLQLLSLFATFLLFHFSFFFSLVALF